MTREARRIGFEEFAAGLPDIIETSAGCLISTRT
jgi:hypothetical protein